MSDPTSADIAHIQLRMLAHERRLEAIEARQRASSQHDPDCYSFDLVPLRDDDSVGFGPCDCWLSEEP